MMIPLFISPVGRVTVTGSMLIGSAIGGVFWLIIPGCGTVISFCLTNAASACLRRGRFARRSPPWVLPALLRHQPGPDLYAALSRRHSHCRLGFGLSASGLLSGR